MTWIVYWGADPMDQEWRAESESGRKGQNKGGEPVHHCGPGELGYSGTPKTIELSSRISAWRMYSKFIHWPFPLVVNCSQGHWQHRLLGYAGTTWGRKQKEADTEKSREPSGTEWCVCECGWGQRWAKVGWSREPEASVIVSSTSFQSIQ